MITVPWLRSAALAAALLLSACSDKVETSAADQNPVVAGDPTLKGTTIRVADQFGLIRLPLTLSGEDRGLTYAVDYASFQGAAAVLQAFQAGAVDFGLAGDAILTQAQDSGIDLVVVAIDHVEGAGCSLLVSDRAKIASLRDVAGKRIGYTTATGSQSFLLNLLDRNGQTIGDVKAIELPVPTYIAALSSGDVDAVSACEPLPSSFKAADPEAKVLTAPGLYSGNTYLIATRAALADPKKAAAIGDFLARHVRGVRWRDRHPDAWVQAYYVDGLGLDAALGAAVVKQLGPTSFPPIDDRTIAVQQRLNQLSAAAGSVGKLRDAKDAFSGQYNALIAEAAK